MSVKASLRFEVLKRDRFTCCYCGKTGGETLLEVDHVVPKSAGGKDAIDNLLTACLECNRGKGSRLLMEGRSPLVSEETIAALRDRLAWAKEYDVLRKAEEALVNGYICEAFRAWMHTFGGEEKDGRLTVPEWAPNFPHEGYLRGAIRKYGIEETIEAIRITGNRFNGNFGTSMHQGGALPYFLATLRNRAERGEGVA